MANKIGLLRFLGFGVSGVVIALLIHACATTSPSVVAPSEKSILPSSQPVPESEGSDSDSDSDFVDVAKVVPNVVLDIRYATTNNFLGEKIYDKPRCLLRWSAAKRLIKVQYFLSRQGLKLKIFDCYRPLSAQQKMFAIKPDPTYVADPKKGSRHNRGMAVDLTLVGANNKELEMPTQFDDFSPKAHRSAQVSPIQAQNRQKLEDAMVFGGFVPLPAEWWHFDAPGWEEMSIDKTPL